MPAALDARSTLARSLAGLTYHHVTAARPAPDAEADVLAASLARALAGLGLASGRDGATADLVIETSLATTAVENIVFISEPVLDRTGRRITGYRQRSFPTRTNSNAFTMVVRDRADAAARHDVTVTASSPLPLGAVLPCLVEAAVGSLGAPGQRTVMIEPARCDG